MRNHYLWVRRTHTINVISGKIMQSWAGQISKSDSCSECECVHTQVLSLGGNLNVRFSFMRIRTVVQMLQKPAI